MGAPLTPGTKLHGRYIITTLLQASPSGALYLGTDALAAAKVIVICENADLSLEAQARFEQEAQLLARLEHPSLPVVLNSFNEPSGRQYLVLLGYEEPSLDKVLADGVSLAVADVLGWFRHLASAVSHLHAQNPPIVHGHISPAHIVITADGMPHLTGLVDWEEEAGNSYLAPERQEGRVDERTDVYGLAATLYTLLTGKEPAAAGARAAGEELAPPDQLNRAIPAYVAAALQKALELDPDARPASVEQFWQALTQPVPAEGVKEGGWRRPRVPRQRPRRGSRVLIGAGAGVVALAAVAVLAWRLLPSRQAESPQPTPPSAAHVAVTRTVARPTATLSPPPSPTVAPATSTPTVAATNTPVATPQPAPSATPRPAATRWIAGPSTSATPRWFPAPELVSPGDGAVIKGSVEFRWSWPYTLAEDEYFDLQVYRIGVEPTGIAWCKEPYYHPPSLLAGEGQYQWRVRVIRGRDGQVEAVVSDPSPVRILTWRPASDKDTEAGAE